jgi:hypothetical protein
MRISSVGTGVRRRVAIVSFAAVLLATTLTGCTSARSGLGTSASSCYLALPTADQAVHGHGHFLGVKLFTVGSLRHTAPHLYSVLHQENASAQHVCAVGYSGQFSSKSVKNPRGKASGHLAVVVSTSPGNRLLATVIFTRIPLRFTHTHLG